MNETRRLRLVFHAVVVLLTGLLCGPPTVVEAMGGDAQRFWHTAHEALIMMGVWMLAMSAAAPILVLERRDTPAAFVAFLAAVFGIGRTIFSAALTLMGAQAALKATKGGA